MTFVCVPYASISQEHTMPKHTYIVCYRTATEQQRKRTLGTHGIDLRRSFASVGVSRGTPRTHGRRHNAALCTSAH